MLVVVAVLLGAASASAQDGGPLGGLGDKVGEEPFELTADMLEFESGRNLYVASGNVVVVQGQRTLKADWLAFNRDTGAGIASGNVLLIDGGDTITAEFVAIDVNTLEGVVFEGWFDSEESQFRGEAARIARTGEQTYEFEDGSFTTCRCPDDEDRVPWKINAEEAEIEVEGYGVVRNATVDVFGVPLAFFPWMIYPIKTERQTGLLFPEIFLASRNGLGLGIPFFWAPRHDLNVTVTPSYRTKRGPKADLDVEYVFGAESKLDFTTAYGFDTGIDANSPLQPFGRNRWVAMGEVDAHIDPKTRFKSDFRFASDNQYPVDFDELEFYRTDRFLESKAFVGTSVGATGRYGAVASAFYADDRQNPDDQDRDAFLLQRLPSVSLPVMPGPTSWLPILEPSIDVDYTWYQSFQNAKTERPTSSVVRSGVFGPALFLDTGIDALSNPVSLQNPFLPTDVITPFVGERGLGILFGVPTDPSGDDFCPPGSTRPSCRGLLFGLPQIRFGPDGDGVLQEGEPLADQGHKIAIHPRLAAPVQLGFAELYPEVGWHQTLYATDQQDFAQRGFVTARMDLRTRMRRRFEGADLEHVLEPFAGYALALPSAQSGNPIFMPQSAIQQERVRALDLDTVTRDPADRIRRANRVSFGLANRFYGSPYSEGPDRLIADVSLSSLYDFEEGGWGSIYVDGRAYPTRQLAMRFNLGFEPDRGSVSEGLLDLTWSHVDGHSVGFAYRYLREVPQFFEDFTFTQVTQFKDFRELSRLHQISGTVSLAVTRHWSVVYTAAYSFEQSLLLANQGTVAYTSQCRCWSLGVKISDDRARGVEVRVLYSVAGLGQKFGQRPGDGPGLLDSF